MEWVLHKTGLGPMGQNSIYFFKEEAGLRTFLHPIYDKATGLLFDQHYINLNFARQWLRYCDTHDDACKLDAPEILEIPLLFVDIQEKCIVKRSCSKTKYAALSYVWGGSPTTKVISTNIEKLMTPMSLSGKDVVLPHSIQDAIYVTKKLGLRYIWVDCLSIIQDDPDMHIYLKAMASIYRNAYITLVITDGKNANSGIRGLGQSNSSVKPLQPTTLRFPGRDYTVSIRDSTKLSLNPWATRGWTFQEGIFANRILLFNAGVMSWICQCDYREEGGKNQFPDERPISRRIGARKPRTLDILCQTTPGILGVVQLIGKFASREFTDDSDIMDALAGVWNIFVSNPDLQCLKETIYGHPIEILPQSLYWTPTREKPLIRRNFSTLTKKNSQNVEIPSWSWLSWRGELDLLAWFTRSWEFPALALVRKQCVRCAKLVEMSEVVCCPSDPRSTVEKFSAQILLTTKRASFPILCSQTFGELIAIVHPDNPQTLIGELRFDVIMPIDLLPVYPEARRIYGEHMISLEGYNFIAINDSWDDPIFNIQKVNRSVEEKKVRCIRALCIEEKDDEEGIYAKRIGTAMIDLEIWNEFASKDDVDVALK